MKKNNKLIGIGLIIFGMFFINLVNADVNSLGTFKQNQCIDIKQVCSSCTYVNISVSYPNSTTAINNEGMASIGSGTWTYNFCNTTQLGRYDITGEGDLEGVATGFNLLWFEINEGGVEINGSRIAGSIFLIFILLVFLVISIALFFKVDGYMGKFISYWVSHVLIIIITFVAWQVGVEGLLGSVALTGVFRIFFYIFTIAMFPMILLSIAWIVYIHAYNEHFQKLIDKGESPETAFAMSNKKKGWIFGN